MKNERRIYGVLWALVPLMVLCLLAAAVLVGGPVGAVNAVAFAEPDEHAHDGIGFAAWTSTTSLPSSGSYYLTADVRVSGTTTVSGKLNLCLNGKSITYTASNGSVFYVTGTMNLYDCDEETEHRYTIADPAENGAGLAAVNDEATSGYRTFTGGYITGGKGTLEQDKSSSGVKSIWGGGVYVRGGRFNLYGGTLIGNTVNRVAEGDSQYLYGGAVGVYYGSFTMYGGALLGNEVKKANSKFSDTYGGAVSVDRGTVTIEGGSISYNAAFCSGGAINFTSVDPDKANAFVMRGGIISCNAVKGSYYGGAMQCGGGTSFEMTGGVISGNVAYGSGGVAFYGYSFKIGGGEISARITGNKSLSNGAAGLDFNNYYHDGAVVTIDEGAEITDNIGKSAGGVYISGTSYDKRVFVTMNGGVISGNRGTSKGGGMVVTGNTGSTFTMNGGTISGNSASYAGGGLFVGGTNKSGTTPGMLFTMNGGTISNNTTYTGNYVEYGGGGVYVSGGVSGGSAPYGTEFIMKGGTITGNAGYGGGVRATYKTRITISGSAKIVDNTLSGKSNNLWLASTSILTFGEEVTEDLGLGVTIEGGAGVFTAEAIGEEMLDRIFSDNEAYYLIRNESSGKGELLPMRVITYTYTNDIFSKPDSGSTPQKGYFRPGTEATVSDNTGALAKVGRLFVGWNTEANGSGVTYNVGDTFEINEDLTLYPVWAHNDSHDDIDWVLWDDAVAAEQNGEGKTAANSLPSVAGNYYLSTSVTISSTWSVPEGETNLCLNGFGITKTGSGSVISVVGSGVTLNIHDCYTKAQYYYSRPTSPSTDYGLASGIVTSYVSGKSFFYGGYITGGNAERGGALHIDAGASVAMYGGTLIGNSANYGGAVFVSNATFTFGGDAAIKYNVTTGGAEWNSGAGIYVDEGSTVIMTAGTVSNNYSCGTRGGGVEVESGEFHMSGGSVSQNASNGDKGGGVTVWADGKLYLSGTVTISYNKDLKNNKNVNLFLMKDYPYIFIEGELTGGTVAVSMDTPGVFTSTDESYAAYVTTGIFVADDSSNYVIAKNADDQLELIGASTVASLKVGGTLTYYPDMNEAFLAWQASEGGTLTLLNKSYAYLTADIPEFTGKYEWTLDLNGKIVIAKGASLLTIGGPAENTPAGEGAVVTIVDSKLGYSDGQLKNDNLYDNETVNLISVKNGGVLNLKKGRFTSFKEPYGAVQIDDRGTVNMYNGFSINWNYNQLTVDGESINVTGAGVFNMYGGSITSACAGYIVLVDHEDAVVNLFGGNISNSNYGGIKVLKGTVNVGGSIAISGSKVGGANANLYLGSAATLKVTRAFEEGAVIYVTTEEDLSLEKPFLPFGSVAEELLGSDLSGYFVSDKGYSVVQNADGGLGFGFDWSYVASGDTISASCEEMEGSLTVKLVAVSRYYDGTPAAATLQMSASWTEENGLLLPGVIRYVGTALTGEAYDSTTAPTEAGSYTARVSVGTVTAEKAFKIDKVKVTVTVTGNTLIVTYDGEEHGISGYTFSINSELYTEEDFTFSGTASASRTNAGTAYMGLDPAQFENTNDKFLVTFAVTDGFVTIEKLSVNVTVNGHVSVLDYDGEEHEIEGYDLAFDTLLYTADYFTFSGVASASRTNAGTTYMGLSAEQFANTNENFGPVTFDVTDGYQTVEKIDATVTIVGRNSSVPYDRTAHEVSGYDVEYSTELYKAEDFTFSATAYAARTVAGKSYMGLAIEQFANISENFETVTFIVTDGYQEITKIHATVTVTGHFDGETFFDGEEHSVSGYDVEYSTELYTAEDFTFSAEAIAARTEVGTTYMGLKAEQFANVNESFETVTFLVTDGYQTILPIDITVYITGHNASNPYDGTEHAISGYDVEIEFSIYKESYFVFSAEATAARVNAGTSYMGLAPEQFANTNANFRTVTFVVTDGYQTITPIDTSVKIRGYGVRKSYDGTAHTISGYDVAFASTLYNEESFRFDGTATASRTNAGTTYMGLSAEQFANVNENFATVTFLVTDGFVTVKPIDVIVWVEGNGVYADYDGAPHSASGYRFETETDLYDAEANVRFSGEAFAMRTNIGTEYMGLTADMFENMNPNFATVTFEVKDGYITVEAVETVKWVTLSGVVYRDNGVTPIGGVSVVLERGNQYFDLFVTEEDGKYSFVAPAAVYHLVVRYDDNEETTAISLFEEEMTHNVVLSGGNTQSTVYIVTEEGSDYSSIAVGGLDEEAQSVREESGVPAATSVSVEMTVEEITEARMEEAEAKVDPIQDSALNKSLDFFEIEVKKTVGGDAPVLIPETAKVLEIAIPYTKTNKRGLSVYSHHDGSVTAYTEIAARATEERTHGTFYVDKENKLIYVYSQKFSTFAIGYTPYYRVETSLDLGDFGGKATVTIVNQEDKSISFTEEDVDLKHILFPDVPKGVYLMTVTWTHGIRQSFSMPLLVGPNPDVPLDAITEDAEPEEPETISEEAEEDPAPAEATVPVIDAFLADRKSLEGLVVLAGKGIPDHHPEEN